MTTLLKAKKRISQSSGKKRNVGGLLAFKQKRGTNQRSHVVRNMVRNKGVSIAPYAPVFHSGENYAFELEAKNDLLFLPPLGYVGKRAEVENIKKRVVADMTKKEIDRIAEAIEQRLIERFATKADYAVLAKAVADGFIKVNEKFVKVDDAFVKVHRDIASLTKLTESIAKTVSAADPRLE